MACALTIRTIEWVRDALEAAGELVDASLPADASAQAWLGAAIDTRTECAGRLFFAIRGETTDGHRFAADAFLSGSPAVIVSNQETTGQLQSAGVPFLLVRDSKNALQELARRYRRHLGAQVVAITGSSGKTTTKEYVRAVLRTRFRTHANPGNFNSQIGVPVTILDADEHCEYLVCEVGSNHPGEIGFLAEMLRPDLAVITNIGDAHIGHFGSRDAIASEKGALLAHQSADGHAILPRDDDYFEKLSAIVQGRLSSFGRSPMADFRLTNVEFRNGTLSFSVNGESLSLSAVGDYNALNACAAFAVGDVCGVEPARQREALLSVRPMPGRGRVHTVAGITVIDESYNASPASMRRSLAMLAGLDAPGRIAVLGDMKELGAASADAHRVVGGELARLGIGRVFWMGDEAGNVQAGAAAQDASLKIEPLHDLRSLVRAVAADCRAGDVVLVKASRACKLDQFVSGFTEALAGRN